MNHCFLVLSNQQGQKVVRLFIDCSCYWILRSFDVFCEVIKAWQVIGFNSTMYHSAGNVLISSLFSNVKQIPGRMINHRQGYQSKKHQKGTSVVEVEIESLLQQNFNCFSLVNKFFASTSALLDTRIDFLLNNKFGAQFLKNITVVVQFCDFGFSK